jgi:hypothetical protein
MKTEDLVSLLSTGAEAVDLRLTSRRWPVAHRSPSSSPPVYSNSIQRFGMKP